MNQEVDVFTDRVNDDIRVFLELRNKNPGCVLMFPPVDNYKRFLIHSSIQNIEGLVSFSVGEGLQRRTVISGKENLIGDNEVTHQVLYKRSSAESSHSQSYSERIKDKRRPDRQVYVPKGRRSDSIEDKKFGDPRSSSTMSKSDERLKMKSEGEASNSKPTVVDEVDEDWDSMFAEDGQCLKPDIMKELTSAVRNVKIVPAQNVCSAVSAEKDDEFSHVLEVSNFPMEFKTQDLMMIFMQYKERGFEVMWVDDTHALVIFSSSKIANEAMETKYPGVRLKRLCDASTESKSRARRCGASMKPFKARPETCAVLARRLVTGALGIKSKATKETIENERRILREAKEKKMLARKEQKDIWDDDEEAS